MGYIQQEYFNQVYTLIRQAERTLNGYMAFVRKQQAGADLYGSRAAHEETGDYIINGDD